MCTCVCVRKCARERDYSFIYVHTSAKRGDETDRQKGLCMVRERERQRERDRRRERESGTESCLLILQDRRESSWCIRHYKEANTRNTIIEHRLTKM